MLSKTDMQILPLSSYVYGSTEAKEHVMHGRRVLGTLMRQFEELLTLVLPRKDIIKKFLAFEPENKEDRSSYYSPYMDFNVRFNEKEPGSIILTMYQGNKSVISIIIAYDNSTEYSTIHDFLMKYNGELIFNSYVLDKNTKFSCLERYKGYSGFRTWQDEKLYIYGDYKETPVYPDPKYTVLEFLDLISDINNPETFEMALLNEMVLKDVLLSCILSSSHPYRMSFRSNADHGLYKTYRHVRYSCYLLNKHTPSTVNS